MPRNKIITIIAGLILAIITLGSHYLLSERASLIITAAILFLIALVYIGFGIWDGQRKNIIIEICGVIFFALIALAGIIYSPKIIAFGYFAHGIWDMLHHPKALQTRVWNWYPPLCLVYDWFIAVYIFAAF